MRSSESLLPSAGESVGDSELDDPDWDVGFEAGSRLSSSCKDSRSSQPRCPACTRVGVRSSRRNPISSWNTRSSSV